MDFTAFKYEEEQRYPFFIANKGCESERVQLVSDLEHNKLSCNMFTIVQK